MKYIGLIREMDSLEGGNLEVFYYLRAPEIWPDKRGARFQQIVLQG
jgi:hypothetical protein